MNENLNRELLLEIGQPSPAGDWSMRVTALEPWSDDEQGQWMSLIERAFINLATVGGLCGANGNPLNSGNAETVEIHVDASGLYWQFGRMDIDAGSVSLLANLCEWGALNVAPASAAEILPGNHDLSGQISRHSTPEQLKKLSFPIDLPDLVSESIQLQVQFVHPLTAAQISQINHLLTPWVQALCSGGFALMELPIEQDLIRFSNPPLTIVDNLWCWNFERFLAGQEAFHVLANVLERIHRTDCLVSLLTGE